MTKTTMSRERKQSLRKLAKLMNTRHRRPWPVTSPLLACFDVAVNQQEVDFLLRFGIEPHDYSEAEALSGQSKDSFKSFFDKLIRKGFISKEHDPGKEPKYLLAGIAFGWFEVFFADGKRTAEQKKLAVKGQELTLNLCLFKNPEFPSFTFGVDIYKNIDLAISARNLHFWASQN